MQNMERLARRSGLNGGAPLLTLSEVGSDSELTELVPTRFDTQDDLGGASGLLILSAKTRNGAGGTPTSPGAGKTVRVQYAFSELELTEDDAPSLLDNVASSLVCTLPDSATHTDNSPLGTRYNETTALVITGRYLYLWGDTDAFDSANAKIDVTVTGTVC